MEYFIVKLTKLTWIVCVLFLILRAECLEVKEVENCYANVDNLLQPVCPDGQVVYPFDIFVYSKRRETNCMDTSSGLTIGDRTLCCTYVNETEDCGLRYGGDQIDNVKLAHYLKFTGERTAGLQVAWNNTLGYCDQTEFFARTHYMKVQYNCINTSQSGSTCNSSLTGNQVFLWNDGYPKSDGGCASDSGCTCTIQSSGGSKIQIDAFDIRFSTNQTTGKCAQRIVLTDGGAESDIACDDINIFERRTLFTSVSDAITLRYDNTYDGSGGNFWISIQATDSSSSLTVTCGKVSSNVVYNCGENFTIISLETTTAQTTESTVTSAISTGSTQTTTEFTGSTETTTAYTGSTESTTVYTGSTETQTVAASKSVQEESKSKGSIIGIIIGVVAGLAVAGMVGYGIWRKHKGKYKVNPDDELSDLFSREHTAITSRPPETFRPFPA